jgi:LacI family transcriptional regulator/LacI family repressor for deo operon, udp, cdd, tsx, nupC, and nupG
VRVPEDVSVVGYDDIPAATLVSPALTTVTVPLTRLGRAAVDLLVEAGPVPTATESALASALSAGAAPGEPPSVLIGVELVVRASTGVVAGG